MVDQTVHKKYLCLRLRRERVSPFDTPTRQTPRTVTFTNLDLRRRNETRTLEGGDRASIPRRRPSLPISLGWWCSLTEPFV